MERNMNNQAINSKLLIKSTFWYTVGNFLTKAISFITIPIFTRLMTKQQYADFSVFASWQSIFLIICGVEIYATLNRARFDYDSDKDINSYISSCLTISSLITFVIFVLYLCFPSFFNKLFLLERKYVYLMFAYLITQPAFQMFQAKQRVEYKYKLSASISFFLIIFSTLLAVFLVKNFNDKLLGRIIGQYVPFIIFGIIIYLYFFVKNHTITFRNWKYALKLGLPLVFSFLGSQILLSSDRVVVQHLGTHEEVAWLVLATSGAHIILLFVQTLNNAWAPWFFDKLKLGCNEEIRKTFNIYMWFILVCTIMILLLGPEIVSVLGGKNYSESIYVLPANMLCGIFTVITSQLVNLQTYFKKTYYAALLTSIVAIVNIIGDIIGVYFFGYKAACYVTVLCQLLLIGLHYCVSIKLGVRSILPLKQLLSVLIIGLLLIPFSLLSYKFLVIRLLIVFFLVVIMLFIAYNKRELIMNLLKRIKRRV